LRLRQSPGPSQAEARRKRSRAATRFPPHPIILRLWCGLCDSLRRTRSRLATHLVRTLRRRTRSRLWLALCDPPRIGLRLWRSLCDSPSAHKILLGNSPRANPVASHKISPVARLVRPPHRIGLRLWRGLCDSPSAHKISLGNSPCANPPPHRPSPAARPLCKPNMVYTVNRKHGLHG